MIVGKVNMRYVAFVAVVAAVGGFLFGYDTAVISGTIDTVAGQFSLDALQKGWYVGCALVGSIFGVSVAGMLGDSIGRKRSMILSAVLFTVSAFGCAVSATFAELVAYRIVGGVGIGIVSVISPLYISEMSVPKHRGRLVSLYQLAITVGFLGAYMANYALLQFEHTALLSGSSFVVKVFGSESWRGMLGLETLPAVVFLLIIFFIPESPRWLMLKRREDEAMAVVGRIYENRTDVETELSGIRASVGAEKRTEWRELSQKSVRKMVIVGVAIAILGQFMGVNAVLYYGPSIFSDSGLSSGDSLFYQVLVGSVNMLTTILALLIIDKVGRKKLVYYDSVAVAHSCIFRVRTDARHLAGGFVDGFPGIHFLLCHIDMCRGVGAALGDVSHEGQRTCNVDCRTVVVGGHLSDRTADAVDALHACAYRHIPAVCSDVCALHIDSVAVGA